MDGTIESTSFFHNQFLSLLRLGIGKKSEPLQETVDWDAVEAMAVKQDLLAVIYDAVQHIPESQRPSQVTWLRWIGQVMQGNERLYAMYRRTISEMASFYNAHGFKMMVLKGYACGLDWPRPEHRPYGDIDIWLFGRQEEADAVLAKEKRIKIDKSHHHHTVFEWNGFTVENHYDFVNVHAHRSSAVLEKIFKELGSEENLNDNENINSVGNRIKGVEVDGQMVYLPSPNLHALFLMKHMASHFAAVGITLRQVLDWAFFVEKHTNEVDWEWLDGMLVKFHVKEFVSCINAICVEDLGLPVDIFPEVQFVPELKERVLEDILDPEYTAAEPKGFILHMIYKYKRWQGNAWKQKLCYEESRWLAFWTLLRSHLIKP